jgi:hypothetical protein
MRKISTAHSVRRFPLFVCTVLGLIGANDFMQLSTSRGHIIPS